MEAIWDRQMQIILWRNVELAWLRQISPEAATALEADGSDDYPAVEFVDDAETRTRHEFTAFLHAWVEGWSEQPLARRWVHFGLTSSDVIDTATALQLVRANNLILTAGETLAMALSKVLQEMPDFEQVGRTHGQWAQPRTAWFPLFTLLSMLDRQRSRVKHASFDLAYADLSGPTGDRYHTDPEKVVMALGSLGLSRMVASTQILPRDGWIHWAHTVSALVTVCETIADHYWLLAQSGIDEVTVGHPSPSSAMPHKRNPHLAENVRGLARMARHFASMLDESIVQRGDRDLAHSSVERVALPDLCHLAMTALRRTTEIVETYRYNPEIVRGNLLAAETAGARSAEKVSERILAGQSRAEAMEMENPHG
jgi:adenylosuccinate lyase